VGGRRWAVGGGPARPTVAALCFGHRFWYAAAVLACLLGAATKEILVAAPIVVLLYDRAFLAGSFREAWRQRRWLYVGLAATWGLLGYLMCSTRLIVRQTEMRSPDPWSYACSEPGVILYYLRLSVWPRPLCMSYQWPDARGFWQIFPGTLAIGLLLAATVRGLLDRKGYGFLGAWFFLILAPTSSILPLNQTAFEHRMYLSLAAVAAGVVAQAYLFLPRWLSRPHGARPPAAIMRGLAPLAVVAVVLTTLGYATSTRNSDYRSAIVIYEKTLDKCPQNYCAHNNLGLELAAVGRNEEALKHYEQAIMLKPDYTEAYGNLGATLAALGRPNEAMEHYRRALRLRPDFAEIHNTFAAFLAGTGNTDEAIEHYREALRLKPNLIMAHNNLGAVLIGRGQVSEGIEHYRQALRVKPDFASAHNNLALALVGLGSDREAVEHYREAVRLEPDYAAAHNNLAVALAKMGNTAEALEHYRQAVRLEPDSPRFQYNLAKLLIETGTSNEALGHLNQALRLQPDFVVALNDLAWLLATREPAEGGDPARAVELAQRLRDVTGGADPVFVNTLAAAYAAAGRFEDAARTAEQAVKLAESAGQALLASQFQACLQLYRAGRPYRDRQAAHGPREP
jgi:tetratricopeptide (TPR) repeat protein